MKVLFVCTGNTCRSAMCEAYFNDLCRKNGKEGELRAESAGTNAWEGDKASPHTFTALAGISADLAGHSARRLTREMIRSADLIVPMTEAPREIVLAMVSEADKKTHLLTEYFRTPRNNAEISDPFGGDAESYARCFAEMREPLDRLYELFSKQNKK